MEQHLGRPRILLTLIIAKGYVHPPTENHGSISKKLAVWIGFERVCQKSNG